MLGSWLFLAALVTALGGVTAVGGLWVWNYSKEDIGAPEATRLTSRRVVGVVSGAIFALAIGFAELTGLLGTIGDVVAMFPGGTTQAVLGALAVAGFAGWVEIGLAGATVLVIGIMAVSAAFTN